METSDQSKCSTDVNEENRNACCSPCSDEGINTAARHYCEDCAMYFCVKCVKCHNKIPSLASHQVNDIDSPMSTNGDGEAKEQEDLTTEILRCSLHHGKLIDTYCKDHDEVCCGTCGMITHRLCSTESIAKVAKDFKSNPEVKKCTEALTQVLDQLKQEKEKRTENIDRIGKQKLELIETVDTYEEKIIAKIKDLANTARREIRSKYEENKKALDVDVETLHAAMATSTEYISKLEQTKNGPILFGTAKTSKKVTRDGEMLLHAMMKEWTDRIIRFHFDETLENTVDGMTALGRLEDDHCVVKAYRAVFQKNVNVTQIPQVFDMCLMESGDLLLADYSNKKLKRYNSDLQYKDEINLSGLTVAVCQIDKQEIAVRSYQSKSVNVVSVGTSLQLTSSFTLAGNGYGMAYDADTSELYACEENKLSVYSKTGNKLRTYDRTTNDEPMFSQCKQIALSENKQDIYVTDINYGVVVLDKSGHLKMKVSLSGIDDTYPLCLLPGRICLTGSSASGKIVQLNEDGKPVGTLIDTKDGRAYTHCAVYDRENSRLIVGGSFNIISVYTMSAK